MIGGATIHVCGPRSTVPHYKKAAQQPIEGNVFSVYETPHISLNPDLRGGAGSI
jgi:hypothetical protein